MHLNVDEVGDILARVTVAAKPVEFVGQEEVEAAVAGLRLGNLGKPSWPLAVTVRPRLALAGLVDDLEAMGLGVVAQLA